MADFTITGGLDPRGLLEGLKQFEQQATASGARAGEALSRGVASRVGSLIPTSLSKALQAGENSAASSGAALGRSLATGVSTQVGRLIPSSLQKALGGAASSASSSGQQLGTALATGVSGSLRNTIPAALGKALNAGSQGASQSGKQVGSALAQGAGSSLQSLLPPAFLKAVGSASAPSRQAGVGLGSGLGGGIGTGLSGTVPGQFKRVFATGQGTASGSGQQIGQALGQGIGRGVDQNKALFASVVNQAQKAAREVGLVFNAVKLRFETPKGEIVPQRELDKLRQLNPALEGSIRSLATFSGQAQQTGVGVERLGSGFTNASRQGGVMTAAISGISFALTNTLTNAMGSATTAIRGLIGDFTALDTEIRKAATAAEEPGAYERLELVIDKVGIEAAGTQKQVAELATSLVRAGYKVSEVEVALGGVVRGAEATGTSFDNMGSIVGNTLRGFGLEVDQTSRVVDVLVKAANASNASVEGLGYTFQYAAPVANTLKVSLEDLAATAGLMANAGIDASVAGTGLRTGLQRLQKAAAGASGESLGLSKGQERLSRAMQTLGADVTTTAGTLKPLDQVFLSLKERLAEMSVAAQIELASAIFGDEAGSKFLAVVNQSEQSIAGMFETIRNAKGSTDVARGGMQGFQMALLQLEGSLGVIRNSFGKVLAAGLAPFLNAANTVLGVVAVLPGPIKTLAAALTLLVGAYVAAKVAATAFGRAVQQPMVAGAIKEVQVLTRYLRMEFKRDLMAATAAWRNLQASLKAGSSNAAVAGLAKIVQGLRSLNAAQAVAGFKQLGKAIADASTLGTGRLLGLAQNGLLVVRKGITGAGASAAQFGAQLLGMANQSKSAELGLTGVARVLQQGMTVGANTAAKASTGLSTVLLRVGTLTGKEVAAGFQAAGVAMKAGAGQLGTFLTSASAGGPITLALAAAVAAVAAGAIQYNNIMGKSRAVTAALQPSVDQLAQALKGANIAYTDFGKQGGPVAEALTSLQRSFSEGEVRARKFVNSLGEIPVVGAAVQLAAKGLANSLRFSVLGVTITGIQSLISTLGSLKKAYDDSVQQAKENQAINEAADQFAQLEEQVNKAVAATDRYVSSASTAPDPSQLKAFTAVYKEQVGVLTQAVASTTEFQSALTLLAQQEASAGNSGLAAYYKSLAANAETLNATATRRLQQLQEEAVRTGVVKDQSLQLQYGLATLTLQYQKLGQEAARLNLDVAAGDQLVQTGQELMRLEESRFNIVKARSGYELEQLNQYWEARKKQAQDAGAGEAVLNNIEKQALAQKKALTDELAAKESANLQARMSGLAQQQALENAIFTVKQQQRAVEADFSLKQKEIEFLKAKQELNALDAGASEKKKQQATETLAAAQAELTAATQQKALLDQSIPLETLMNNLRNEQAVNALKAEGAARGITLEVGKALVPSQAVAEQAAAIGYRFVQGADGALTLQRQVTQAGVATSAAAGASQQLGTGLGQASAAATQAAGASQQMGSGLGQASQSARNTASGLGEAATKAGEAAKQTGNIGKNANPTALRPINQALGQAATDAKVVATAQMAANLSKASGSAGGLSNAMKAAATAARDFYNILAKASGLPGSRWTGGPVEGGQRYRINDGPSGRSLGQESFLSASGRLSLINRPTNSLWTAPSSGVVIPAGVTDNLKDQGVFAASPKGQGAVSGRQLVRRTADARRDQQAVAAQQAVAIGKLQQSVDRLVEKDWNVQVRVRNDAGGASHLNMLNRMR